MGIVLLVIGAGWALIGFANIVGMYGHGELTSGVQTFGIIFNMLLFILPGGVLAALGEMLRRRKAAARPMAADAGRRPCPQCGESIASAANVCRFCGASVAQRAALR